MYAITLRLAKYKTAIVVAAVMAMGLLFSPTTVGAADEDVFGINKIQSTTVLGKEDLTVTITRVINIALSLLGIVAVVIVLIGGFKIMTSGGNEDRNAEGRKLIFAGILGLAIILSAWAIARFVLIKLGQATGTTGAGDYNL